MEEIAQSIRALNKTLGRVTVSPSVGVTISQLAASPTTGQTAVVTDGDASLAWGATVVNTGAGATKYFVWYNGTNWTVMGE